MNHHALLIGINEYPTFDETRQLKGCVNDTHLLRGLLTGRFGFRDGDITTLLNEQATRDGVLRSLARLAGTGEFTGQSPLQAGDLVVVAYSGHGTQMPDLEGDEADGLDSALVPTDSDRPAPIGKGGANRDISDDTLFTYFESIRARIGKGGHLVLWFDCCHSGTISRDIEEGGTREIPMDTRLEAATAAAGRGTATRDGSGWQRLPDGYVLLAACADDEKAREIRHPATGEPCGAMTCWLLDAIAARSGRVTYRDVFTVARREIALRILSQNMQLEGDADQLLFALERVNSAPFAEVLRRDGERQLTLAVGAAQGATAASEYALYPQALTDETLLAIVTLTRIGALQSSAEAQGALPPTVQAGCRAVEQKHAAGEQRLVVAVEGIGVQLEEMRQRITQSPLLRLARNETAQVLAVCHPSRSAEEVKGAAARGEVVFAPELGAIGEPTWVVVGHDLRMLPIPPHAASEPEVLKQTVANLETWARNLNVQRLRPTGIELLKGQIRAEFGAQHPEQKQVAAPLPTDARSGLPLVRAGTSVRLVMENLYTLPVYITVFSLDAVGAVTRVYPQAKNLHSAVKPNTPVALNFKVGLPTTFPVVLEGGQELIKLFVTLVPVDFDSLEQGGTRGDSHPALTLYESATRGGGDAPAVPVQPDTVRDDSWTTVEIPYRVER